MSVTQESFLRDVKDHVIEIQVDDGVRRHVRFRRPGTLNMHFDLITWPGYLCYTGDMGTYVFRRLEDMFEFFRHDKREGQPDIFRWIDRRYWAEKLEAEDKHDGVKEFSKERFTEVINEYRVAWMREMKDAGYPKEERRRLWEEVDHEVLDRIDDGEHLVCSHAYEFGQRVHKDNRGTGEGEVYEFTELWDHTFTEYTHRFQWCCYALRWGIQKYDEDKAERDAPRCACCGTKENLHRDLGSGGPYRCNSPDCMVY